MNDEEQHTKTQKKRNNAVFDHTMHFPLSKMTREEIENTIIKVSAYDAGFRLRNGLIGTYQLDARYENLFIIMGMPSDLHSSLTAALSTI